jgi:hypothetical protein
MSTFSGANPVESGLVFHYDMGNIKRSWKGAPTTNLVTEQNLSLWSSSNNPPIVINSTNLLLPHGIGTSNSYTITDDSNTVYKNIYRAITVPNDSNTYIISMYIKKANGSSTAFSGFNVQFSGGTTPIISAFRIDTNTGTVNAGTLTSVDSTWWRWSISYANNSTGNTTLSISFYPATGSAIGADNVSAQNTCTIGGIQIEVGLFATPFVSGTRSNTQALIDLSSTGNNTITCNSLTYNSNGTFSFNDLTDYITTTSTTNFQYGTGDFTIDVWLKSVGLGSNDYLLDHGSNGLRIQYYSSLLRVLDYTGNLSSLLYTIGFGQIQPNIYYNAILTRINGVAYLYLNGILTTSEANTNTYNYQPVTIGNYGGGGAYKWNGSIPLVRLYKGKGLTANDVLQNYNSAKSRFGL